MFLPSVCLLDSPFLEPFLRTLLPLKPTASHLLRTLLRRARCHRIPVLCTLKRLLTRRGLEIRASTLRPPLTSTIPKNQIRERPPWVDSQHVLTVLVFWSWVLLLPRLPPSSRSLRLFPWASILLQGSLDICLDLLHATPLPTVQKQDAQHIFLQHRGAHAEKTRLRMSSARSNPHEWQSLPKSVSSNYFLQWFGISCLLHWTKMAQNGQDDHFGQNGLILNWI